MVLKFGKGRGLGHSNRRTQTSFTPLSLFAASEPGAWYDPSDLSTLFQDAAGTTPVTAAGQVVGLVLDKSNGLVLGPELITNGRFSDGTTGWSFGAGWSVVNGAATITSAATNISLTQARPAGVTEGKTYVVTFDLVQTNGTTALYVLGNTVWTGGMQAGSRRLVVIAGSSGGFTISASPGFTGSIDNISVRELPGNHASQTTTASKPILACEPLGGRRNLVPANSGPSEGTVGSTPTSWIARGTVTAALLSGGGVRLTIPGGATASTDDFRQAITALIVGAGKVSFDMQLVSGSANNQFQWLIGATGGVLTATTTRTRVSLDATFNATSHSLFFGPVNAGSATTVVDIFNIQVENGSTATAYQKVTTAYDVTEAGKADLWFVLFDGVDDYLATGSINFTGTDKMTVLAGVRKLSDAARGMVAEIGTGGANNWGLNAPSANLGDFAFASAGSTQRTATGNAAAPTTAVLTGLGDISGDSAIIRTNAVQQTPVTLDQGTGNFASAPLYIGRRSGTSLPFNGRLYGLIVRGATTDAATIAKAESWLNSRTGAY